jgi:hypothetical protein
MDFFRDKWLCSPEQRPIAGPTRSRAARLPDRFLYPAVKFHCADGAIYLMGFHRFQMRYLFLAIVGGMG